MRFLPFRVLLAAALLVPLRPARAQVMAPDSLRPFTVQLSAAPALQPWVSIAREQQQPPLLANVPYRHVTRHEGMVLMLVGAAGIVTGLIVDEPAVTILSAGVGGVGLYFHLR